MVQERIEYILVTTKECEVCRSVMDFLHRNDVGYEEVPYEGIGKSNSVEARGISLSEGNPLPQLFDDEGNYLATSFNIIPYISKQNALKRGDLTTTQ